MPLRIGEPYVISFQLNPNKSYFEAGVKPRNMSKSTVDYPNNMCLSAFENYESFKSSGGSLNGMWGGGGGGR